MSRKCEVKKQNNETTSTNKYLWFITSYSQVTTHTQHILLLKSSGAWVPPLLVHLQNSRLQAVSSHHHRRSRVCAWGPPLGGSISCWSHQAAILSVAVWTGARWCPQACCQTARLSPTECHIPYWFVWFLFWRHDNRMHNTETYVYIYVCIYINSSAMNHSGGYEDLPLRKPLRRKQHW